MATLFNTQISATYPGLIKTTDNSAITATLKQLTDGSGNNTGLFVNNAGDFKVTAILEWGSLKDTGTGVTITQWVTAANGIANFNNDTTVPTSAAVKTYVDAVVTASDLDFKGDSGTGEVDLDSQILEIAGTTNEITTVALNQKLTIGLPNSVTISGTYTGATFLGDLNGTINTATTATTQSAGTSNSTVATTKFVMDLDSGSDLDFSGDSGTGDVTLNTQVLAITGTTNQIVTAAANQGLNLSLPATVHRNLQGNVTGNVDGDLTGNVTATSVLLNGVSATTQSSSDSSTKVATTAYVKGLNNASDLDFTTDSGSGAVVLNTETLSVLGTTNQINSAGTGQAITLSLPSTIQRNLQGNVTGDLTGNADTATAWETARSLSVTGEATGTLLNVNGTQPVSGAVTLDNNSVTGKVLTGLSTPAASTVLPADSILEGIGKLQSQINGIANGLQFQGSWDADQNSPNLVSGGGEADSGTTTATLANKLVDTTAGQNFLTTVSVGDKIINQVDRQTALVTNVDSNTVLSIDADIMLSGEAYTIDNSPFITQGHYYVVNVGGNTSLNGISTWSVGDWVIAGATNVWEKLDHTDVEGVGTPGNIAKWSATGTIADSIIAESGAAITVTGSLSTTTNLNSGSNFAVATNKFTANGTTGNVAFVGDLAINTNKFTVNATSGNTLVAGTINSGAITSTGNIQLGGTTPTLDFFKTSAGDVLANIKVESGAGTGGKFTIQTKRNGNTALDALVINDDQNATFAGNTEAQKVTSTKGFFATSNIAAPASGTSALIIDYYLGNSRFWSRGANATTKGGFQFIQLENDGGSQTTSLAIDSSSNATFAGSVTGLTSSFVSTVAGTTVVSSEGAYAGSGSVKLFEAKRNGGAVKSDWSYNESVSPLQMEIGTSTSHSFAIKTADTPRLTIDNSGNVGIGGSPTFKLDVLTNGSSLRLNSSDANGAYITWSNNGTAKGQMGSAYHLFSSPYNLNTDIAILAVGGLGLSSNGAGSPTLYLNTSGNATFAGDVKVADRLLINAAATGSPYLSFDQDGTEKAYIQYIDSGAGTDNLTIQSDGIVTFRTGPNTERMRILSTGDVCIGTSTPSSNTNYGTGDLNVENDVFASSQVFTHNDTAGNYSFFGLGKSSGTGASPTIVQAQETVGAIGWYGYDGAAYKRMATIQADVDGTPGAGDMPGRILFATTSDGASTPTERMRITSEGSLVVGTATVAAANAAADNIVIKGEGAAVGLTISNSLNSGTGTIFFGDAASSAAAGFRYNHNTGDMAVSFEDEIAFANSGGERMRITSGGDVLISTNTKITTNVTFGNITLDGSMTVGPNLGAISADASINVKEFGGNQISFFYGTTKVGGITSTSSATAYNTSSDYRLKEDLQDFAGLDMVSKIPVYDFKWKTDENRSYGVMAHELQEVLPDAVSGKKDAEEMQGVDYSKIVPLLVKSIQELKAEVDLLKQECNCK